MALVVPDTHALASHDSVPLGEVSGEDFVWVAEGTSETHPLYAACLAAGFAPRIACVSGSAQGMQSLVAAGLGIALLPRLAISALPGTRLVELGEPRPFRTLVIVWRAGRLSYASEAFLAGLQ